jgi:hypothetical protein
MKFTLLLIIIFANSALAQLHFTPYYKKLNFADTKFSIAEVYDARLNIDFGLFDKDSLIKFEKKTPLDTLLKDFINKSIPYKSEKTTFAIKINEYQFGLRNDKNKEILWFYADLEFFKVVKHEYLKICQINECKELKGSENIEILINRLHWKFWNNTLDEVEKKYKYMKRYDYVDKATFYKVPKLPAIFIDSTINDGIYRNFAQLKYNSPEKLEFEIHEDLNDSYLSIDKKHDFDSKNEIWGVCKNGQIYKTIKNNIFSKNYLIPVQRFGNSLELASGISEVKAKAASSVNFKYNLRSTYYHASIGLLGLGSMSNSVMLAANLITLAVKVNQDQRIFIDMNSGILNPAEIYTYWE